MWNTPRFSHMEEVSEEKISNKSQEQEMLKSLDGLLDETLQILEINNEENNTTGEICETVKMMLLQLRASITISPELLDSSGDVKRASLGYDGRITITHRNNEVEYKQLNDLRPSKLMEILNDVFPKLKNATSDYRKTIEERLTVYRTANNKMKKIHDVLKEEQKTTMDDLQPIARLE